MPRGRSLGHVWQSDGEERVVTSRSALLNQMAVGLGGRAAEKLVFGEPGSGAADDLSRVSGMARRMVRKLGMSEALGDVTYEHHSDSNAVEESYSEEELRLIGAEVRRLVEEAGERAREVLEGSRATLDRIAAALIERETVSADELQELVGRAPVVAR